MIRMVAFAEKLNIRRRQRYSLIQAERYGRYDGDRAVVTTKEKTI